MSSRPLSSPTSPSTARWVTVLTLVVAAGVFAKSLGGGFISEDFAYLRRFHDLPWTAWPHLFVSDWSAGIWGVPLKELRPFAALSFMAESRLWGGDPLAYRVTNLLLHLANVLLVLVLARRITRGHTLGTLAAGLIFALHPAHAEPVAWITGRVDLLGTLGAVGFLVAAEAYADTGRRRFLASAALAFFGGVFSKELALLTPLLLGVHWLLLDRDVARATWRRRAAVAVTALAVFAVYAACRHAAFGGRLATGNSNWHQPDAWERQASYLGWIVPILPFQENPQWARFPSTAVLQGLWLTLALLVVVLLVAALLRRRRLLAEAAFFGGVWFLVTAGSMVVANYFTPRHLYFPSVGWCIGLGTLIALVPPAIGRVALAGLALAYGAGHFAALRRWTDSGAITRETMSVIRTELARAPDGTVLVFSAPEERHHAWVWAWASPFAFAPPFLTPGLPPDRITERTQNYYRAGNWSEERHPLATLQQASHALVVHVDPDGAIHTRSYTAAELAAPVNTLASQAGAGITPEQWTAWVSSLARP